MDYTWITSVEHRPRCYTYPLADDLREILAYKKAYILLDLMNILSTTYPLATFEAFSQQLLSVYTIQWPGHLQHFTHHVEELCTRTYQLLFISSKIQWSPLPRLRGKYHEPVILNRLIHGRPIS